MSPAERCLAETEAEIARRAARRIDHFLKRPDLSPECRELARAQRDEYRQTAHLIEQSLKTEADLRARRIGVLPAFGRAYRYLRSNDLEAVPYVNRMQA